jgi:hypothetical protein
MSYRNAGVAVAVLSLLASAGFAFASDGAASTATPGMSIAPAALTLDDAAQAPLMAGLDKVGMASPLTKAGINVYGWIEAGYTYNNRNSQFNHAGPLNPTNASVNRVQPGAFNYERNSSPDVMVNQISIIAERKVDSTAAKWDIGGKIWVMYGTDSAVTRSNGLQIYAGQDAFSPTMQFDFPEAYVDVAVPIQGLSFRAGRFATLIGNEYLNPTLNPFYSRSWLYASEPITHTGVLGMYTLNDQWSFVAGITRGWDQATEDNNGAPAFIGQVNYAMNKQWSFTLNTHIGPEDNGDTAHYRTLLNPIASYQFSDKLKLSAEGLYVYDGGIDNNGYGDYYGGALYAAYTLTDQFTLNARGEAIHYYTSPNDVNVYELTLGVTITPMPKDKWLSGLMIRPEVRYDYSGSDTVFTTNTAAYHDQLTFGGDVIFKF